MSVQRIEDPRIVAIIQARMTSTRLPGKVLKDIAGQTMLASVVRRVQRATLLDKVVVATTVEPIDDVIAAECACLGVPVFRGDEEDVLNRFYRAAQAYQAQVIVRITADCPLVSPQVVDRVIREFLDAEPDYASNCTLERTYPRGLDTEAMTIAALERAWCEAGEPYQRVHVTPYLYQNPDLFRLLSVTNEQDYSGYRWTVDTLEDLEFVRAIYERLDHTEDFSWIDVLALLAREPTLAEMNRRVQQKSLLEG